ncbi:hypothetical protein H5P28_15040 [Ruficoccus amylovorans]|uniref:Uncharacterized protein n=1 Tax=Ruficoccus amylovorans TaxID=1804625 RepID=A0A842HK97_9BACT|nr:hypothetical protein [Ruficoccus amylovorans]MBC2595581.1 hypothetical protein [Ruficoccus amylovorans]
MPRFTTPFFSADSFWNQRIRSDVTADTQSPQWIKLLAQSQTGGLEGLHLNLHNWTIPVFCADEATPRYQLNPKLHRCHLSQGHIKVMEHRLRQHPHPLGLHPSVSAGVPIPAEALPDPQQDAHMVVVDTAAQRAYDFWQCRREADGRWHTNAAIAYDLRGPGVFTGEIDGIHNDESVHAYGPCRASGVPLLAGLIMKDEIDAGHIAHKLAFACPVPGLQCFQHPATWTDGWLPGGLPEGCVLQLSPELDLGRFELTPAARTIARALQEYGAVLVDYAGGVTLYGEWLEPHPGLSWEGVLAESDLASIGFEHFRILQTGPLHEQGSHPVFHQGMSRLFYDYIERHGTDSLEALEPWRHNL